MKIIAGRYPVNEYMDCTLEDQVECGRSGPSFILHVNLLFPSHELQRHNIMWFQWFDPPQGLSTSDLLSLPML